MVCYYKCPFWPNLVKEFENVLKYAVCSILAYPFKPHPLKNVQNHDMVPLQLEIPALMRAIILRRCLVDWFVTVR